MKLTLGTGSFLSVNTGSQAYPSISGSAYPAVGWKLRSNDKPTYILESDSSDTGTSILWAQQLNFFEEPAQTINLANSVPDSGGVFFVCVSAVERNFFRFNPKSFNHCSNYFCFNYFANETGLLRYTSTSERLYGCLVTHWSESIDIESTHRKSGTRSDCISYS